MPRLQGRGCKAAPFAAASNPITDIRKIVRSGDLIYADATKKIFGLRID